MSEDQFNKFRESLRDNNVFIDWVSPDEEWNREYHVEDVYLVGTEVWIEASTCGAEIVIQLFRLGEVRWFEFIVPQE